jgi:hypothetical protein
MSAIKMTGAVARRMARQAMAAENARNARTEPVAVEDEKECGHNGCRNTRQPCPYHS